MERGLAGSNVSGAQIESCGLTGGAWELSWEPHVYVFHTGTEECLREKAWFCGGGSDSVKVCGFIRSKMDRRTCR